MTRTGVARPHVQWKEALGWLTHRQPESNSKESGQAASHASYDDWIDLLTLTASHSEDLLTDTIRAGKVSQVRLLVCQMFVATGSGEVIASPNAGLPDTVHASTADRLHLASECLRISNLLPGTWTMGVRPVGFANGDSLIFTAAATPPTVTHTPGCRRSPTTPPAR